MSNAPNRVLDEYLVVSANAGSREAFDRLVRRWTPRLLRYATRTVGRPDEAADIVQDTWIGAIRGLRQLTDASQFPAWIYSIARRKCVDAIRANQRLRRMKASAQDDASSTGELEQHVTDGGGSIDLNVAISRLGVAQREVVQLFYGEDLSVEEIAVVLAVPPGTVKSRLHHARYSLKKHIGE